MPRLPTVREARKLLLQFKHSGVEYRHIKPAVSWVREALSKWDTSTDRPYIIVFRGAPPEAQTLVGKGLLVVEVRCDERRRSARRTGFVVLRHYD